MGRLFSMGETEEILAELGLHLDDVTFAEVFEEVELPIVHKARDC